MLRGVYIAIHLDMFGGVNIASVLAGGEATT
jgi:hypothetical protein